MTHTTQRYGLLRPKKGLALLGFLSESKFVFHYHSIMPESSSMVPLVHQNSVSDDADPEAMVTVSERLLSGFRSDDADPKAMKTVSERLLSGFRGGIVEVIICSPILFSISGFKHTGKQKVKMDVLAQFIPEHLADKEKVKTCIVEVFGSGSSTHAYRTISDFDLTEGRHEEEPPCFKLTHPCYHCHLQGSDTGHDGMVKVGIKQVFNELLFPNDNKNYFERQINCQFTGTLLGNVIFSKLEKPPTGWKKGLSKVFKRENIPYVGTAVSATMGVVGYLQE